MSKNKKQTIRITKGYVVSIHKLDIMFSDTPYPLSHEKIEKLCDKLDALNISYEVEYYED